MKNYKTIKVTHFFILSMMCIFFPITKLYSSWDNSLLSFLNSIETEKLKNHPFINFWYGESKADNSLIVSDKNGNNFFSPMFDVGFEYGFTRYKYDHSLDKLYLIDGETAFLENVSSHLKPKSLGYSGYTIDGWKFGFSMFDGIGNENNLMNIDFSNKSTFSWNRFDFEQYPQDSALLYKFKPYDIQYKFGCDYSTSLTLPLLSFFHIELNQENSLIYPNFDFSKWVSSFLIENIINRWSDPFDGYFFEKSGKNYYIYKFIYKTLLSYIIYEIKKEQSFAPFSSEKPFSFRSIKLKLVFIAE